jgi:hypothetical protein
MHAGFFGSLVGLQHMLSNSCRQYVHAPGDGRIEYYGSWKQDRYHGKGVMVLRDGWKFTGAWEDHPVPCVMCALCMQHL